MEKIISDWLASADGYAQELGTEFLLVRSFAGEEISRQTLTAAVVFDLIQLQRQGVIVRRPQPGWLGNAIYDLVDHTPPR